MREPDQCLRRSIGIVFSDGGLLALTAVCPAEAAGHGEEEVAAVICGPDGAPAEIAETLLSTEYGPDGVQRRATLELWPEGEEGHPLRGGRHADQLDCGTPARPQFGGGIFPLVGRGARGTRTLRGATRRWLTLRSRSSSPTSGGC